MTEKDLLNLKREIETAKANTAELRGQHSMLLKELKETWKCNSIDDANKLLEATKKEAEKLSTEINEAIEKLEQKYVKIKQ